MRRVSVDEVGAFLRCRERVAPREHGLEHGAGRAAQGTLRRTPGSMFEAMFSGRHTLTATEEGTYFIDRDATHFRYILNYLPHGRAASSVCRSARPGPLAAASIGRGTRI